MVVAELRRDRAADTVEMQAIKYAAMVAQFDVPKLATARAAHLRSCGEQVIDDEALQRLEDHADGPLDLCAIWTSAAPLSTVPCEVRYSKMSGKVPTYRAGGIHRMAGDAPLAPATSLGNGTRVTLAELRQYRDGIRAIAAQHGVVAVRVFGSVARGDADEESDVDLLVELESGRGLFDLGAFLADVQELVGESVDVVTPKGLRSRIRDRVIREAVAL